MKFILSIVLSLSFLGVFSQQNLAEAEDELVRLGKNTITLKTEEERLAAADSFAAELDQAIDNEESFSYPFEKVSNLSKLISPSKDFRIYSWAVPLKNGGFNFYGRLVLKTKEGFKTIELTDGAGNMELPEYQFSKPEDWYGVIYYDIRATKNKSKTYYTLFGYRPNTRTHNEKVLDVLELSNLEKIRFGEQIFNTPKINGIKYKKRPYRLIFRYNPKSVATIKYVDSENKIIMDHLSVPDASMKDNWAMYGPDFSYDALFWEKGQWQLEEEIQAKTNIKPTTPQPTQKGLPKK